MSPQPAERANVDGSRPAANSNRNITPRMRPALTAMSVWSGTPKARVRATMTEPASTGTTMAIPSGKPAGRAEKNPAAPSAAATRNHALSTSANRLLPVPRSPLAGASVRMKTTARAVSRIATTRSSTSILLLVALGELETAWTRFRGRHCPDHGSARRLRVSVVRSTQPVGAFRPRLRPGEDRHREHRQLRGAEARGLQVPFVVLRVEPRRPPGVEARTPDALAEVGVASHQ